MDTLMTGDSTGRNGPSPGGLAKQWGQRVAPGRKQLMFGLSIRTLLLGLFALMIAVVVGLGAFALGRIAAVNDSTVEFATRWLPAVAAIRDLEYQCGRYRIGE